jgi:hypothetical protein
MPLALDMLVEITVSVCPPDFGMGLVVRRRMPAARVRAFTPPCGRLIGVRPDYGSSGTTPTR